MQWDIPDKDSGASRMFQPMASSRVENTEKFEWKAETKRKRANMKIKQLTC